MAAKKAKKLLRVRFGRLAKLTRATEQQREFELERLLFDLAALEGVPGRLSYRGGGEQIDGLLVLDCRHFLVETKWTAKPVSASSASDVYAFRAKVDGKLVGTVGLFVSVAGFGEAVPDVLRYGKEINVLLVDGEDLQFALDDKHTLSAVVRAKVRRAAQLGDVFYPYVFYPYKQYLDEGGT